MPETFDVGPLWEGGKKTEPEPAETDELGRPKPDPNAYLKDGDWWLHGKPCTFAVCPPDCQICAYETEQAQHG